jgi:hypothetical protein
MLKINSFFEKFSLDNLAGLRTKKKIRIKIHFVFDLLLEEDCKLLDI